MTNQLLNDTNNSQELYLDLMKKCLTFYIWGEPFQPVNLADYGRVRRFLYSQLANLLAKRKLHLYRTTTFDPSLRLKGLDHPAMAHTMIGLKRLDNIQFCIENVLDENVPGDLIETGVWRGGATIFMRAVLAAYGVTDKRVWVADSFQGLPQPNPDLYPHDKEDKHYMMPHLAVSQDGVKRNFSDFGLLDDQVRFLKGWFKDTLPNAPIDSLAILRIDGDLYESTLDALTHLYHKVSPGGYVIVDDYGYLESCRQAVHDFRAEHMITDEIVQIDWTGVFWKRSNV